MTPRGVRPFVRRCPTCGGRWDPLRGFAARKLRIAAGLTMEELADRFEVTYGYIRKVEAEHIPLGRFLAAKYKALGAPPSGGPKSRV